ncbi:MAG: hypothetical protein IE931_12600 [Sphingobacteriales bacterium]|nr:hypothetical protein [Sphingobacteriales bacterium]
MNNIITKINKIIKEDFDKDFFLEKRNPIVISHINKKIQHFQKHLDDNYIANLISKMENQFPKAKVEDHTQFFNLDRCLRISITLNPTLRFICLVSIYDFFCVYQHPLYLENDKYIFGEVRIINESEIKICDELYNIFKSYFKNIIWIKRDILTKIHSEFTFEISKINLIERISIMDILFTNHYI